jgi:predicted metal-dependent phosphoesterase TrpH
MKLLKVELHCHSYASKDSLNKVEDLIRVAHHRGVQKLAITDHNNIKGALRAKQLDPELIIVGEEILTSKGELLTFFLEEEIPHGLEPLDAIQRLREQGAFISVSHPYDRLRHGWELEDLKLITPYIDAIEVFNARSFTKNVNEQAGVYAAEHNLIGTVGSDAHTLIEVGRATLTMPFFNDVDSFRTAIVQSYKNVKYSSPLVRFGSMYARLKKQIAGTH